MGLFGSVFGRTDEDGEPRCSYCGIPWSDDVCPSCQEEVDAKQTELDRKNGVSRDDEETGYTCVGCSLPLLRSSERVAAYEEGNSEAYVKCSRCRAKNYLF